VPLRKIAIISDIHGNYHGLMAVVRDIELQSCNHIICLGDLVDGGADNDAVVRFIRDRAIPTVLGNHDEINDLDLAADAAAFLSSLPEELVDSDARTPTFHRDRTRRRSPTNTKHGTPSTKRATGLRSSDMPISP
jgi:predicted phosphodiesterase